MPSSCFLLLNRRHQLAMDVSGTSSTLSSSESNEYHEHNIWNPMLELLFHTHIGISTEALFCEKDMGRIALSCHFALDVLCDKRMSQLVKRRHTLDDVPNKPSRTVLTKRASGDSITLDNYDLQSLEFAQQLETGPLLTRIDHSVHDGYARNSLLSDPVIFFDDESVVKNVI